MTQCLLITYVPLAEAGRVREAIGKVGAGIIGEYSFCSFSSRGVGRFIPSTKAHPAYGNVGRLSEVKEERIEVVVQKKKLRNVVRALRAAHPYEEPIILVLPLEEVGSS